MGRYRVLGEEPLGEGAWCVVWKARHMASGREVAVKTFRDQVIREKGMGALHGRFAREIDVFKMLGVAPGIGMNDSAEESGVASATSSGHYGPKQLFVNLLDFSRSAADGAAGENGDPLDSDSGHPSTASDGRYYTVLELADWSLDKWIAGRSADPAAGRAELCEIARTLSHSLAWLHGCGLCHSDVKPANMMRFGTYWKLIDLEGVMPMDGTSGVDMSCVTPLYACPEVARAALEQLGMPGNGGCIPAVLDHVRPAEKMDVWAAGIVLLDVLARKCALEEMYSGFRMQALMSFDGEEDPTEGLRQWYEWLADPAPILPGDYACPPEVYGSPAPLPPSSDEDVVNLRALFAGLLAKDPAQRLSTAELLAHPALACDDSVAKCALNLSPARSRSSHSKKRSKTPGS